MSWFCNDNLLLGCDGNLLAESNRRYQDYAGRGLFFRTCYATNTKPAPGRPCHESVFFSGADVPFYGAARRLSQ